ncbi:MAG: ABC transporter substrate-binding protein [Frankiaceae bacterium]|nr:ABC transporter substrate-binding protein [Frankiaceae bacterium]
MSSAGIGRRAALGAMLAAALVLAACSGSSNKGVSVTDNRDDVTGVVNGTLTTDGPARDGGSITVYDTSDSPSLDISQATYTVHIQTSGLVYNKLIGYKTGRDIKYGAQQLQGDLADSWSMSPDGTQWTVKLHQGVKFQNIAPVNGHEFTSAEVACTLDWFMKTPGAAQQSAMSIVDRVETPDAYTAIFVLKTPFAAFDQALASYNMEMAPCELDRGEYDIKTTAIGTGPYILSDWQRGVSKTYTKNPNYFVPGKPHLDKITILIMSNIDALMAAYRTHDIDLLAVPDNQMQPMLSSNPNDLARTQLSLVMPEIFMNQDIKPFDNLNVRKAIALGWDRKTMGDTFNHGYVLGASWPGIQDGGLSPDEAMNLLPYDPTEAKKLLADAGYPNGFDVELTVTDGYGQTVVDAAQFFQQDLKNIGINATLKTIDYSTWAANVLTTKGGYSIAYGLTTSFASTDEWLYSAYLTDAVRNSFKVADPALDKMIVDQRSIFDPTARTKALHDIATYIATSVIDPILAYQIPGTTFQQAWVHNLYSAPAYERPYMADVWVDSTSPRANDK